MYFPDTSACQAPNSLQPPTQAQIMFGVRMLARMEGKVRNARQAFNCLLYRDDLNTNGWPLATQGGVPSSTITGCPSPGPGAGVTSINPGAPTSGVNNLGLQYWPTLVQTMPDPTGLAPNSPQTYPQPPAPYVPPLTTQAHSQQAAALTTAAAAAATTPVPSTPPTFPTTGNICLDLILNYVDGSQVSMAQQMACNKLGYPGQNINGPLLTTPMVAWRGANYSKLPKVPDQPNVPTYTQAMGTKYGLGDWDGGSFIQGLISAVGLAAGAWYLYGEAKRRGYIG